VQRADGVLSIIEEVEAALMNHPDVCAEDVQGLEKLLIAVWLDSSFAVADRVENVALEQWNARKVEMGGASQTRFEICRQAWKSESVSALFCHHEANTYVPIARSPRTAGA
jgi:hypothetical protein